jgi:hypothetical protein
MLPLFSLFMLLAIEAAAVVTGNQRGKQDDESLLQFLEGRYKLVGKSLDSERTFLGKVIIRKKGKGLEVLRTINDATVRGSGRIENATADRIKVLRIRFQTPEGDFEGTYLFGSDLDNYARITGYLYRVDRTTRHPMETQNPGLEALFPSAGFSR